jgi:general secretion pathway protein L
MKMIPAITRGWSEWIDSVSDTTAMLLNRFDSSPTFRLLEEADGNLMLQAAGQTSDNTSPAERVEVVEGKIDFSKSATMLSMLRGSRVELILRSDRFLFRPLELPTRAAEFVHAIVRAQIDRLTPWSAANAAFGWISPPTPDGEKMVVTVAATSRASITPYVRAIAATGAQSISVLTFPSDAGPAPKLIKVWEQKTQGAKNLSTIRGTFVGVLAASAAAAIVAICAYGILGSNLAAERDEIDRQIATLRAAGASEKDFAQDSLTKDRFRLARRKREAPSTVLILEELSKILPDHTYVTELRIEGNKLQLIGITRDAPSLIGLIEQAGHFKQATFFAPTTRAASNVGDRFSIEAIINSVGSPVS